MKGFFRCFYSEWLKLYYLKITGIVIVLTIFVQGGLAFLSAKQMWGIGIAATPETNKNLMEAIPPLEHFGFETVKFGLLPMVILGAVYGAFEFRSHGMRTSLLSVSKKGRLFGIKLFLITKVSLILSFLSVMVTIFVARFSLEKEGVSLPSISAEVWSWIGFGTIAWGVLTVLAFELGFLFRTAMVPLIFLIPQIYNFGDFLAERIPAARFLPVYLCNKWIADSERIKEVQPLQNLIYLLAWVGIFGVITYLRFHKRDLGGE